uniref:Heterokaryon incompatibility domain-containing protein n=1 Tax=Bionectria ochroleuca TaxID=29856 RepID=A0A8H7N4G9_BIOOC
MKRLSTTICNYCQMFQNEIWEPHFDVTYNMEQLRENSVSGICEMCQFLARVCQRRRKIQYPSVSFHRAESSIFMDRGVSPVISIHRSKDLVTRIDSDVQVGFARLPQPGSDASFEIIRQWLQSCDNHHGGICPPATRQDSVMPTRVIDVGTERDHSVRLIETRGAQGKWIALSHQWGTSDNFCTTPENKVKHMNGIEDEILPATFRDAVKITRALGRRHLWIDSVCIIQGRKGDFASEAKRMEQVYSGAYCVLATSRSPGHDAGILQDREERDVMALQAQGQSGPFYLSQNIDDFDVHVLKGALNQRGWVLQEHALARRTVYFTDHQMYFECGQGVRCETMSRMTNETASFLGDPDFPQIIMSADKGERILLYQDLYTKYSRLGLSRPTDRAVAIGGWRNGSWQNSMFLVAGAFSTIH